jgi:tetratricopeptide (TPR) repeat protein
MADNYFSCGETDAGLRCIDKAIGISSRVGNREDEAYALSTRGEHFLEIDEPRKAYDDLALAKNILEEIDSLPNCPYVLSDLGLACLALGEDEKAKQFTQSGLMYAEQVARRYELGYALDAVAQVATKTKNYESAETNFQRAITLFERATSHHYVARSRRNLARMYAEMGRNEISCELFRSAIAIFKKLNLKNEVNFTYSHMEQAGCGSTTH